jgi:hypothetical protein
MYNNTKPKSAPKWVTIMYFHPFETFIHILKYFPPNLHIKMKMFNLFQFYLNHIVDIH